jgi:sulfite reductase alpha subunit-like flavoprotein
VLREPMRGAEGRTKEGVCSTQLGALRAGDAAFVSVRSSGFALPADPAAPVMMVGPGTGIAPFRAFLQEMRAARGAAGGGAAPPRTGPTRLYFGCRRDGEDYLYTEELAGYVADGTLSSLRLAFSREQAAKVYVQHRVREDGAELWALLQRGGHFYLCGGTSMGRDVVAALTEAVATHGQMAADEAESYVKALQAQGRLVQELWS